MGNFFKDVGREIGKGVSKAVHEIGKGADGVYRNIFNAKDSFVYGGDKSVFWGNNKGTSIKGLFDSDGAIGRAYNQGVDFGDKLGMQMGLKDTRHYETKVREEKDAEAAAIQQAHDTEVSRLSQEAATAIALRRRRGMASTMLATGSSGLGGPSRRDDRRLG